MEDKEKIIKDVGNMAIYVGTASIIKPIIKQYNQNRNPITKVCSTFTGVVISLGVSHVASKWFNKIVDKVGKFVDDVKSPKKKEDGEVNG